MNSRLTGSSPGAMPPDHTTELICWRWPVAATRQWLPHRAPRRTQTATSATSQDAAGLQPPLPRHGLSGVSASLNVHTRGKCVSWLISKSAPKLQGGHQSKDLTSEASALGGRFMGPYGLVLVTGLTASPLRIKPGPRPRARSWLEVKLKLEVKSPALHPVIFLITFFENVYSVNYLREDLAQCRFPCRSVWGRSKSYQVSLVHNNYTSLIRLKNT